MTCALPTLPPCRWREKARSELYACRSAKYVGAPNWVSAEFCAACRYADHEPPPPLPRALPCVHLGVQQKPKRKGAARLPLFACAVHDSCAATWTEGDEPIDAECCARCDDYLPRDPFGPDSVEMLRKADAFLADVPRYPSRRYRGRGVLIAGGGPRYFPSLYVTIRALRHVGCTLPIQVWYLGRHNEMPRDLQVLLEPWQVECIDADKVRKRRPARKLDGWELKVFATLHCSFEELLFLDADCYPCRNPEFLFDLAEYRDKGAIFWPEWVAFDDRLKWPAFSVPDPRRPGSVESGQYVLHKRPSWRALNLAWFYNDHSDYYYRYCYGDKHTFEVAWTRVGQPFVMFTSTAKVEHVGYLHEGPDRETLFIHRCSDKFRLDSRTYTTSQRNAMPGYYGALPMEKECWGWLTELARTLGVATWCPQGAIAKPVQTPAANITVATLHTPEIADYGEVTARVLCRYAERHGYRTLTHAAALDPERPPAWSKIPLIERGFADRSCEWLAWFDADALIVRHDVPLTAFLDDDADFIVADDSPLGPLNTGVFFIRNCPAAHELLRRAWAKTEYLQHRWWDQAAIIATIREKVPGLRVKIVPRQHFNSFAREYREGDFVIHYPGQSHGERTAGIRRRAAPILFPMPSHFRPGTNDAELYQQVFVQNEYGLGDDMAGTIVLDIGAHIGIFAYACAARGAAEVWSVEAHPENFAVLERNLDEMQLPGARVALFGAAWGNLPPAEPLHVHFGDGVNRGGRFLTRGAGADTTMLPFDDIVRRVTNGQRRRIDLLKLDCEAAEFPILYTSQTLDVIDAICGEIHPWLADVPEFEVAGHRNDLAGLRRHLESAGFRVMIRGYHLWAQRPRTAPEPCLAH